ncbi:MAG: PKD domain-containing protein, partial [Phaeodactylibacter sp.]|nr:PKD domain-containing protein [Phaeodactylibacter sp.]
GTALFNGATIPDPLTHTFNDEGFSTITVIVEGGNGCMDTAQYSFYQGGTPAVGLSIPTQPAVVCAPTTISFPIENVQDNPEGTLYTVTVNDGSPPEIFQHPPPASFQHTFFVTSCGETSGGGFPDAFSVTIQASNPCGQASSTVEPLNISTQPVAIIETDIEEDSTCLNNVVEFCNVNLSGSFYSSATQSCTDVVTSDWTITPATGWSFIGGTDPTDQCIQVEFTDPGIYFIDLISENPCGSDMAQDTIIITEPVFADASASTASGSDCTPKEVTFNNSSTNFASVEWTISPNTGWTFAPGSDAMTPAPTVIFTTPGTYDVTLTVENDCGDDSWMETITVIGMPTVSVVNPPNGCETATFIPSATVSDNGGPVIDCLWEFPGGTPASSTDCDNPPMVTFNTPGANDFTLAVTNECGTTIDTGSIFINNPNIQVFGGPDTTICENSDCLDWIPIPNGGVFSGDITSSDFCPPDVSVPTIFMGILAFGPQDCQSLDTFYIEVLPIPEIDLSNNPGTVCTETLPFTLNSIPVDGDWSGPGISGNQFDPMGAGVLVNDFNTIYFTSSDTTQTGGNSLLCSNIDSIQIFVEGPTAFTFPDTLTFCQIDEAIVLETELGISEPAGSTGTWDNPIFTNVNNGTFNPGMLQDSIYEVF